MNILFVHNHPTSFVRQDIEYLRHRHQVSELYLQRRTMNPLAVWRQVRAHDLVFGWFASWHTFLPALFAACLNTPFVMVIGGYDLANDPAIGYGHQRGGLKKWISRATMRLATALITSSNYNEREAGNNAGLGSGRADVIYHGVPDFWSAQPATERDAITITIGNVDRANLERKGLTLFVKSAELLPAVRFIVIGAWKDDAINYLKEIAGANVEFTGWVDDAGLQAHCAQASVYVQASRHEGFGMAVAEAMLAGCIPVVTNHGALPEVVGDCGVYCNTNPQSVAWAISQALNMPELARLRARERVLTHFSPQQRRASLESVVSRVASGVPNMAQKSAG